MRLKSKITFEAAAVHCRAGAQSAKQLSLRHFSGNGQCVRRMRKLSPAKGRRKLSLAGESNWPVGEWANGLNPTQTLMLVLSAKGQQLALPYLCSMTCEARDPPVDLTGPDLEAASCGSSKRSHRPADDIWDHFKKVKFLLRSYILGFTIYYKP